MKEDSRTKWHIYATDNEYDDDVESICVFVGTVEEACKYAQSCCLEYARNEADPRDVEYISFLRSESSDFVEAATIQRGDSHRVYWVEKFEESVIRTVADISAEDMALIEAHPDGFDDYELSEFFDEIDEDEDA